MLKYKPWVTLTVLTLVSGTCVIVAGESAERENLPSESAPRRLDVRRGGAPLRHRPRGHVPAGEVRRASHQVAASGALVPQVPVVQTIQGWCRFGCRHGHACCIKPYESLGMSVQANMESQILNGKKARLVLYDYDFQGDERDQTLLNRAGQRKLQRLLPLMESTGCPLVIDQHADHPEISEARRIHVIDYLANRLYFLVTDAQVVVGSPPPLGLSGVDGREIYQNQLRTTRSQGTTFSGFDASGFDTSSNSGSGTNQ